jgi:hypothetical protein
MEHLWQASFLAHIGLMESVTIHLHKATDAEDSYAICLDGDGEATWRARRGYGGKFERVWSVELQSARVPAFRDVDWNSILGRMIEAWDLNDPVITEFNWPMQQPA